MKVSGGLLHPVSSVLGNLLWCCSDFLPHVNRWRDRGASMMVWGSCCRRRGFKNWSNKAGVVVCGMRRGRRFHLQAPCVMCDVLVRTPSDQSKLCVSNSLCGRWSLAYPECLATHFLTAPTEAAHVLIKLYTSSQTADFIHFGIKTRRKDLFAHVLLILIHDRKRADACQSCGGGALPFHTQLASCLASVLRQYLSFSVWQKQSHWFLILIPFFSYWSPIHP